MRSVLGLGLCLPLVLAGCAISPTAAPSPDKGLAIQGHVSGGRIPIKQAHIYLFAANTTGYGAASVSLLNAGGSVLTDSVGTYVNTDDSGNFSISGAYSCTQDTQVYIYALGGDTGSGVNNPASGLLAVLGNCPSDHNFATATPYIVVNEVSTVAAAYAFAGFATDATHVSSSGTALAKKGIANAFANAANMAKLSTGEALATTPNGNGIVPQGEIYAMADILASCVNTTGAVTGSPLPACGTLFTNALSSGTTGTQPTDTATAAINIAHNPGANVGALFGLVQISGAFATTFAQPNDFTISLQFTGGGLSDPYYIAIDGAGSVWATNNGHFTVSKLLSTGVPVSGTGYTTGNASFPNGIAIDSGDNAWVANYSDNDVIKLSGITGALAAGPFTATGMNGPYGVAIDGSDSVWVSGTGAPSNVTKLSNAGVVQSGFPVSAGLSNPRVLAIDGAGNGWIASNNFLTVLSPTGAQIGSSLSGNGVIGPFGIAIDHGGNAWVANQGGVTNRVSEFASNGTPVSGSPFSSGGIDTPVSVAIDGAGNAWIGNNGSSGQATISEISSAGSPLSPSTGYVLSGGSKSTAIAVDGSGNVWTADNSAGQLTEVIGVAVPVVTPLAVGVKNNTLGTRP